MPDWNGKSVAEAWGLTVKSPEWIKEAQDEILTLFTKDKELANQTISGTLHCQGGAELIPVLQMSGLIEVFGSTFVQGLALGYLLGLIRGEARAKRQAELDKLIG